MNECGDRDRDVILKTDQEPAIKFLVDDVCVNRTGARTIAEMAPKYSKGSNGVVERAVQAVEQCLRTMKSSLDERMGVKIDVQHPVITWMCEFVGYMMNRMEVAADGKTPYERVKGKKGEVLGLEFGERVMWKHHPGKTMEKLNARWGNGLFLGVRSRSNELIVVDEESKELKYVRTVKRVPEEQRWNPDNLEWVTMVPWNKGGGDKEADGDLPEFDVKKGPGRRLTEEEKREIATNEVPKIVHKAHLRRTDFDKHGYTDRCPGCSAILRGLHVQPHSQACRERMEAALGTDIRIKNAKVRLQERVKRKAAEEEEKTKRRKPGEEEEGTKRKSDKEEGDSKKRRLDEIEDKAMREEDPSKLAELFEEYRREYLKGREDEDEGAKRKRIEAAAPLQEKSSGSGEPARYEEMEVSGVTEGEIDPWDVLIWETAKVKNIEVDGGVMVTGDSEGSAEKEWSEYLAGDDPTWEDYGFNEYTWDDVNNIPLPVDLVKKARREEMGHMKGKIFKVVKRAEAWEVTGRAPIGAKWVDTDKTHGTGEPMVRSRWVARGFKDPKEKDREDLFSATPPIEMMRFMLSRQATRRKDGEERTTMYLDIKKAHLAPLCEQDVYVELPAEAGVAGDECGKLAHWLYGCRPAAQAWEEHYSALLQGHGFKRLKSVPVAVVHEGRDLNGVVHGDDFVWEGRDKDLDWVLKVLENKYELKNRGRLGFGPKDVRKIDMLGRIIELTDEGIAWQGDPRHQKLLEEYFGMDASAKVLSKNGYDEEPEQGEQPEKELTAEECKAFRMLAARLNYMAQDNPWLQFPAKEICRNMAKPSMGDFGKVKRVVRFLKGAGEAKFFYEWQNEQEAREITVIVDSDWAGCKETRKSTSGGVLKIGRHVVRAWSSTQPTIATSSGEAELIAMYEGATRGLGLKTMMVECGFAPRLRMIRIWTDSSVAKSFVATRGLGKMRHLEVKLLWLQECVQKGRLNVGKVSGATNVADALTKYHVKDRLVALCRPHGVVVGPAGSGRWAEGGCKPKCSRTPVGEIRL